MQTHASLMCSSPVAICMDYPQVVYYKWLFMIPHEFFFTVPEFEFLELNIVRQNNS